MNSQEGPPPACIQIDRELPCVQPHDLTPWIRLSLPCSKLLNNILKDHALKNPNLQLKHASTSISTSKQLLSRRNACRHDRLAPNLQHESHHDRPICLHRSARLFHTPAWGERAPTHVSILREPTDTISLTFPPH